MWIQILHLLVILIFSFLDFHNILSGQTEYPNYVDVPAFVLFLNFLSTFIIGHYIKKLISIRALWTKFKNLKEEHVVFTQIIIDFIQMIVAIIQVPILHDKSIFFSRYTTLIIIMLIINLIISFFSSKFGVYELYFGFFVSPCLILWTQSALFKYCMLRSVLNFGPITLQYIVLVLIYPQDFKSYGMDNKSPVQHGIEMEIRNPNFTYPLAKLFGRQDSFRLIFILFNYCCFDAFYDYCKFGDSEYMILLGLQVYQLIYILRKYSNNTLEKSFWCSLLFYIVYAAVFMHVRYEKTMIKAFESLDDLVFGKAFYL